MITPTDNAVPPDGKILQVLNSKMAAMAVFEGEHVEKGEVVSDGQRTPTRA